jgi:putative SOS response-associated peptidase YedK
MCGRFTLSAPPEVISMCFDIETDSFNYLPAFNIAPTQNVLTVRNRDNSKHAQTMRWGLIPFWAKEAKIGNKMINARSETVIENKVFKTPFQKRRCLILADSFYEWVRVSKSKQPIRILLDSEKPFAFAGIWESWIDPNDPNSETVESCSIITTHANTLIQPIHDRMPVILPRELESDWLDLDNTDTSFLREIMIPFDPGLMKCYPVSQAVNSTKNEGKDLITPIVQESLFDAP